MEIKNIEADETLYEAWKKVVRLLKKTGAVTEKDCESTSQSKGTVGEQLFTAITDWGQKLVQLTQKVEGNKSKTL